MHSSYIALVLKLFALFILRAAILAGGAALIVRTNWARARRVSHEDIQTRQKYSELLTALHTCLFDALIAGAAHSLGAWQFAESSVVAHSFTFFTMFILYEIWFYGIHRLLHRPRLFWIHSRHHGAITPTPWTSLSFSLIERLILQAGAIGISAGLSRIVPITEGGVVGYFLINFILNVWAHSNIEITSPQYRESLLGRIFITTTYHTEHHLRKVGCHYGLFTQLLDYLYKTKATQSGASDTHRLTESEH